MNIFQSHSMNHTQNYFPVLMYNFLADNLSDTFCIIPSARYIFLQFQFDFPLVSTYQNHYS